MFQFHFFFIFISCIIHYEHSCLTSYIVHDLGVLEVEWKIQVISSLQVDDLFMVGLWT